MMMHPKIYGLNFEEKRSWAKNPDYVANVPDSDIIERKFEFHSRYYVHL